MQKIKLFAIACMCLVSVCLVTGCGMFNQNKLPDPTVQNTEKIDQTPDVQIKVVDKNGNEVQQGTVEFRNEREVLDEEQFEELDETAEPADQGESEFKNEEWESSEEDWSDKDQDETAGEDSSPDKGESADEPEVVDTSVQDAPKEKSNEVTVADLFELGDIAKEEYTDKGYTLFDTFAEDKISEEASEEDYSLLEGIKNVEEVKSLSEEKKKLLKLIEGDETASGLYEEAKRHEKALVTKSQKINEIKARVNSPDSDLLPQQQNEQLKKDKSDLIQITREVETIRKRFVIINNQLMARVRELEEAVTKTETETDK